MSPGLVSPEDSPLACVLTWSFLRTSNFLFLQGNCMGLGPSPSDIVLKFLSEHTVSIALTLEVLGFVLKHTTIRRQLSLLGLLHPPRSLMVAASLDYSRSDMNSESSVCTFCLQDLFLRLGKR